MHLRAAALVVLLVAGSFLALASAGSGDAFTRMQLVTRVNGGSAGGLWVHNGTAFSSALGSGFFVTDIRDPEHPVKLAQINPGYVRDVDVMEVEGRTIAVGASGGSTMYFIDVTDPARPIVLSSFNVGATVHNLAVVPGTSLVYNSRGGTERDSPAMDIVDARDPAHPVVVKRWAPPALVAPIGVGGAVPLPIKWGGCHDVTVFPDVHRAYCAAGASTLILDITDVLDPAVLSVIYNPSISFHHAALPNKDHTVLMVGDEFFGAAAPACLASVDTPVRTASSTAGALWFYDISNPALPVLLSWISPPTQASDPCTAHFGTLVGDGNLLAFGFYKAGVLLVDFSNPALPRVVDQYKTDMNTWDVKYDRGYLFTGDIGRGMTVLRLA